MCTRAQQSALANFEFVACPAGAMESNIRHEDLHTEVHGEIDTHDTRFFSREKGSGEHRSLW